MLAAFVRRLMFSKDAQLSWQKDLVRLSGTAGCPRRRSGSWPEAVPEFFCEPQHESRRDQLDEAEPTQPTSCDLTAGVAPYVLLSEDMLCTHHKLSSVSTEPKIRSKLAAAVDEIASAVTEPVSAATTISALTTDNLHIFNQENSQRYVGSQNDCDESLSSSCIGLPLTQANLRWHDSQLG
mmetsp:Transcript_9892/g.29340  ORF Transcript_9892/g.29340 Transcript_9892/m.29340 type:complete len:181 (-) Transcript_9892:173-715(-)